jgi:hypothetical protein
MAGEFRFTFKAVDRVRADENRPARMNDVPLSIRTSKPSWKIRVIAFCLAGIAFAGGVSATTKAPKEPTTPANWNGIWVIADSFMDKQDGTFLATPGRAGEDDEPAMSDPTLKDEYLTKHQALLKAEEAGTRIDDTGAACIPQGMPRFWHGPYAFEITQTPLQINIYQEWNEQTRRIYLDGRKHNPDADPTFNGHSVGHWQGRELLIDTGLIREDSGLGAGATHSDQIHITEKIKQVGANLLLVQMIVTDPKALAEPWVSEYRLRRKSGMEIEEYVCTENNRNITNTNAVPQSGIGSK